MSTQGANETTDKSPTTQEGGAGAPPAKTTETTTASAAPPAQPTTTQAAPPTQEAPPSKPSPITLGDDDDEIPEGASLLQLSKNALTKRLDRATKKQLKAQFGTDNVEEIKAQIAKAKEYERTQEEQRRAQMSEVDRAKEDAKTWQRKYQDLETKVKTERRAQVIATEHNRVTTIAKEFLDPDYLDTELPIFARELSAKYSREEMEQLGDDAIRAYFEKRVQVKPKLGKNFGATQSTETQSTQPVIEEKKTPTVPATNGVKENERPTARTEGSGLPVNGEKTFKPNLPNSMSPQEAKAAAASQGFRW